MVEIRLFATFREGREKIYFLDSIQFYTVQKVLEYLDIQSEEVAICLVNGKHSSLTQEIKEGDVLALFPPVGGG